MKYQSPAPNFFQWTLDIDLKEDMNSLVYKKLLSAGYKDAIKEQAVYQYYNLIKRKISKRPRRVLYSKEFSCPIGYEEALHEFENKVRRGENLMPFQSDKIRQSAYNDLLLNDWGIQHFHLTRRFRDDGFAQRSQYQIFAFVTEDTVYMIKVYPHNEKDLYSRREMVQILRDNWPEAVKRYRINDVVEMEEKLDDHGYEMLRDAHILTPLELGQNEVYFPIGGGYTGTGNSVTAVTQADSVLNWLARVQLVIRDNAEFLAKTIGRIAGTDNLYCEMKINLLWINDNDIITMCEQNSGLVVQYDGLGKKIRVCKGNSVKTPI